MFQVVFDTAGFAHTGSGNNDLRLSIKIDGLGLITGDCQMKVREPDRADTGIDECHGVIVKAGLKVLIKNRSCFNGQRTVYINRKIKVQKLPFFDVTDKIQELLGSSDCKCRDDQIASAFQCGIDDRSQFRCIVRWCIVITVAIGGFHDHIVCSVRRNRVSDERLIDISNITGENNFF